MYGHHNPGSKINSIGLILFSTTCTRLPKTDPNDEVPIDVDVEVDEEDKNIENGEFIDEISLEEDDDSSTDATGDSETD